MAASRRRLPIVVKLLVLFTAPTMLLFAGFAVVAHEVARRNLEAELGTRLAAIAASAATQIRGKYLVDLEPGADADPLAEGARRKLLEVMKATDVARLYIFDRDFKSRVDTDPGVPIGTTLYQAQLDQAPIEAVFSGAEPLSSVLFEGRDGVQYKAGYAAIYADPTDDREVVLAVGADAPAAFFERLSALRRSLLLSGAALMLLVIGAAVVSAARISKPVRELADAAERIGRGDLSSAIEPSSRDEIGLLAQTMERMRSDLAARDERMQLMLSGIAHEVRNPLGGIQLFAGILAEEIDESDERRSHVARIQREVGYLEAVVESFLDYARRPELEREHVDLGELCEEVCELEAGAAAERGVELGCSAVEITLSHCDRAQIRRALLNLVGNAVQAAAAGPEPREVQVTVSGDGDRAIVEVANTGAPIPADVRERLFEPFFTTREKGTGLGLAFVAEIVGDHGGRVEVDSGEGRRTRFWFELERFFPGPPT
jgi:signal transduction histidine kinase